MKYVSRLFAVILFILFFGFALKNDGEVTLRYFFGYEQKGPLVLMLLVFFVAGAVVGILAMVPIVFRHRRDVSRHKNTLAEMEKERIAAERASTEAPQADSIRST
ncbi:MULTISPECIES: LapA family protein [unclassified Undibacterium]|uniref:LapA family protein n=1 Tax=unclassified Undibacterium TaxID=2630295 RepID=UPI002AC9A8EC|nr:MULTISPECIES: LapA family protein [unclassified Undibacterium]MEB0139560.1 LapA family protein [Undibacterium sp. CCC2.1]MEB0172509.1 LapA family protein [Undibacterium sp. CCC1.1]MEB0176527.1 LapA family protein [Undibacterium sp. CCC3.4]MEB0215619.1 LapA family protein [Undibacterium sp. 5I2]WPX43983.1 LapA family protein [Undibacterium sp. CCC3.4]